MNRIMIMRAMGGLLACLLALPLAAGAADDKKSGLKGALQGLVPQVETPKVEVPKIEAPKIETPKIQAPKIETPTLQAPKLDTPTLKVPPPSAIGNSVAPKPTPPVAATPAMTPRPRADGGKHAPVKADKPDAAKTDVAPVPVPASDSAKPESAQAEVPKGDAAATDEQKKEATEADGKKAEAQKGGDGSEAVAAARPKAAKAEAAATTAPEIPPASTKAYDKLVTPATFKKFNRAQIREMQAGLYEIYKDDPTYRKLYGETEKPLSDSVLGPVTLFWLKRFCADFRIEAGHHFADEAVAALLHFAEIARAQPDWKKILLSADFERWINNQPEAKRTELYKIRRSGTSQQVISVLRLYAQRETKATVKSIPTNAGMPTLSVYQLTDKDFDLIQKRQLLLQKLTLLLDESFGSRRDFQAAVTQVLTGVTDKPEQYVPLVEKYAEFNENYTLTDRSLQKLRVDNMPAEAMAMLEPLQDLEMSQSELSARMDVAALTGRQQDSVMNATVLTHSYVLTEASLKGLAADPANASVPVPLMNVFASIKNVEYPTRDLFRRAALFRLDNSMFACSRNISDYRKERLIEPPMSTDNFMLLKPALPADLFEKLYTLRYQTTPCTEAQLASVAPLIERLYETYRPAIEAQATKTPIFNRTVPIQLKGGSCSCVLDQLAGTVYGFYPFWMAKGKPQQVNFSVMSRIGYYGISFDDQGELRMVNDKSDAPNDFFGGTGNARTDFIRTARKYGSKVDMVIQRSDWKGWQSYGVAQRSRIFDKLSTGITQLISRKMTDPMSRLTPYSSFGGAYTPTMADGVTLHFDDYPTDGDSVALFDEFITRLKAKLKAAGDHYAINLMMSQPFLGASGKGIYDYEHLYKVVKLIDPVDESRPISEKDMARKFESRVLVLMREPTSDAKKRLRLDMEETLHGTSRRLLQRKIVMVMEFNGTAWQQLENDIIYAKDNFGGFGFWTLPLVTPVKAAPKGTPVTGACSGLRTVDGCLAKQYQEDGAQPVTAVCRYVCPSRWAFRFAWDFFVIALVAAVILYFRSCRARTVLEKYWVPFVLGIFLPAFLLSMALLSCDPYLKQLSRGNWPLILVVLAVVGYSIWRHFNNKAKADMP